MSLFWPDDLGLVKSGPELRRRFLNQMLVQVEPGYARALSGLRRVLELAAPAALPEPTTAGQSFASPSECPVSSPSASPSPKH